MSDFAGLVADVRRKLRGDTFWSDTDVADALNATYFEVCELSKCYEAQSTLILIPGQTYYDLEDPNTPMRASSATPYSVALEILRVWNPVTSRWLDARSVSEMDMERPRWGATYGEPDLWIPRGFAVFGVYPKIASNPLIVTTTEGSEAGIFDAGIFDSGIFDIASGTPDTETSASTSYLVIAHTAVPEEMAADGDVPVVPLAYHQLLTDGAVAQLKGLEREAKAAARYFAAYSEQLEDLIQHCQQRTRRSRIPVVGARQVEARR